MAELARIAPRVEAPPPVATSHAPLAASSDAGRAAVDTVRGVVGRPGQPLDWHTRAWLEPRFGHDFGAVRVHADAAAARSAAALGAMAYSLGREVVLGSGRHATDPRVRAQVLAHELAHVAQSRGEHDPRAPLRLGGEHEPAEREADDAARRVLSGAAATVTRGGSANTIRRVLRVDASEPRADEIVAALRRLTGRAVTRTGDTVTLGAAEAGARGSATSTSFLERAIGAARIYRLRSGTSNPDGSTVRGAAWGRDGTNVTVTFDPSHVGAFSWTLDELLAEQLAAAVAQNDAVTGQPTIGYRDLPARPLDWLLTTPLPYPAVGTRTPEDVTSSYALRFATERLGHLSEAQRQRIVGDAMSARGVTLGEIVRGVESGTPYRIRQTISGARVRATYSDPSIPAAGAGTRRAGPMQTREMTFLAGPALGADALPQMGGTQPCSTAELQDPSTARSCCTDDNVTEIVSLMEPARAHVRRAIERLGSAASMDAPLRRHFGANGPSQRQRILAAYRLIESEIAFERHGWMCRVQGMPGCPRGRAAATAPGRADILLCLFMLQGTDNVAPPGSRPASDRWITVLHEIVHASGIGSLPARGSGSAVFERYADESSGYPPADALDNADSYAIFAAEVGSPTWAPASTRGSLTWPPTRIEALVGGQPGREGAPFALGARIELSPLGRGLRLVDWTIGGTFLWLPQFGVVPPAGGPARDITDRAYLGGETGARLSVGSDRVRGYFDLAAGAGALWPGGSGADFALTGRGTAGLRYGGPRGALTVSANLMHIFDLADGARGGWVGVLGVGGEF